LESQRKERGECMKNFWKGVLRVLVEVVLNILKKKVEEKFEDKRNPKSKNGKAFRLLIIVIVGIALIGLTAWVTKPMELPSDVIIIRPLPVEDNPYQREYDEMLSPTVMIETITGRGSGVIIKSNESDYYILTASHVVGNYPKVSVTFFSYRRGAEFAEELEASVIITDTNKDIALLRVLCDFAVKDVKLAPRDYKYYLFAPVYVVGCSLGFNPRPSSGIISAIDFDSVEITAPVLPGNSGGPVYDAGTHELIGIAVWVRLYGDQLITTMAGIVPINLIYEFLDSYRKDAKVSSNS
jgi:S1-C subfamily serine protease